MNTVRQANKNTRFAKIMGRVAFWSATAGLLAYAWLLWQWAYDFPAQTEPRHGVPSGSMSGVGIKEFIGGIIFWLLLMDISGLSLPIDALALASIVSIVSTTIALILVGPRQCKLAWVSLCIFLNTCLLAFLVLDRGNLFYWPHFIPLLLVSYVGFGLSVVGGVGTVLLAVKKTVSHEEKVGRLLQQLAAGGFLLGIVSFVVFATANLFWE